MKVEILSRELIKPDTPTPPSLRDYNISLVDELSPPTNIPTLLYYSCYIATENVTSTEERCKHLKMSLAKALTRFYPLAGRYMKESYMVDCSDQGAEFVEAKVDVRLDDLIGQKKSLKVELLHSLLPRPLDAADEVTDPLLAVQLSVFACGGYTIGLLNSHRVSDMSTTSMFLMEWAHNSKRLVLESTINHDHENDHLPMSPIWTSALLFPAKKCFKFSPPVIPRPKEYVAADNHQIIITKILFFSNSAITRIREKAKLDRSVERLPTRVQSVLGLIGKAIIDTHIAKSGKPQVFSMHQSVNMRERTDPPIPKNQCGNLVLEALAQLMADDEGGGVHLQSIVDLLTCSVKRQVENCKTMLSNGDGGQMMITKGFIEILKLFAEPDSACIVFSDWCKFQFYEADFGWGKPVWVSTATIPVKNTVCLFSDKTGQGIEAWVYLNVEDMPKFEQDSNIMEFTT